MHDSRQSLLTQEGIWLKKLRFRDSIYNTMTTCDNASLDLENQASDFPENAPLISNPDPQSTEEEVELESILSIKKPGYGNWRWVEEQCVRSSGILAGGAAAIRKTFEIYENEENLEDFYNYCWERNSWAPLSATKLLWKLTRLTHRSVTTHPGEGERTLETLNELMTYINQNRVDVFEGIEINCERFYDMVQKLFNDTSRFYIVNDETLFKHLQKDARLIRGWREYMSLKSLRRFGLYRCDIRRGAHIKVDLPPEYKNTLKHFFRVYETCRRHPDKDVSKAWTQWVHRNFNLSQVPMDGRYSLELIYDWSPIRLIVLVVFPVLFSFVVGLVYMLRTGDVSTAWTIASYVVTGAGGEFLPFSGAGQRRSGADLTIAIVALLAILGSLNES
ncbi:MAG: hypothetical protein M1834_001928 [Cirrosporium novae-zelandiae]|nr:MAG: hypothetical protein M1834_001928 [Cirrosporium novae-zelandiae]